MDVQPRARARELLRPPPPSRPLAPATHAHLVKLVNAAAALVAEDEGPRLECVVAAGAFLVQGDGEARRGGRVAADIDAARGNGRDGLQHLALAQAGVADDEHVRVAADGHAVGVSGVLLAAAKQGKQ